MNTRTVLVGFYDIKGFGPDSVEVPCTGQGAQDYVCLQTAILARHVGTHRRDITRTGSKIELRQDAARGYIGDVPGQTIRQLFDGALALDKPLPAVLLGRCFFSGAPYDIALVYSRSKGHVGLILRPRTPSGSVVSFQNRIAPMLLVSELPDIVRDVLGSDARDLRLNFRPPPPLAGPALDALRALMTPTPPVPAVVPETPKNVAEIGKPISKKAAGKAVSK